jgi:hypothetical protein
MKLYYFDPKHQQVLGELELGKLSLKEQELIGDILFFMEDKHIIDGRYSDLTLSEKCQITYDAEDGYPTLHFA